MAGIVGGENSKRYESIYLMVHYRLILFRYGEGSNKEGGVINNIYIQLDVWTFPYLIA